MATHYFKRDGNGGFNIGKSTLAFITIILILLGAVSSVMAYSYGIKGDVRSNEIRIDECLKDTQKNHLDLKEDIQNLKVDLKEDIQILRQDIKDLK